ncbi:MAG: PAS domain S-box protein [Promethearchaeota archaeon]
MVTSGVNGLENSFYRLVENIPGIVYRVLIENDNRVIFLNDMLQIMTGYSPEDLKEGIICCLASLILPEDRLNVINVLKNAIEDNVPFEAEYRIYNKDGELKWFYERGRPIRGDNGNPSYIEGVIFDITDRKVAEKKLKIYEESLKRMKNELEKRLNQENIGLRESEKKFKTIFDESPIGIELYDSNGKLVDTNESCLDIFGVSNINDVRGFDLFKNPNIPKDDLQKLRKGQVIRHEILFDFDLVKDLDLYKTKKSGKICIDLLISPLYLDKNTTISNYLVQLQDITDRKIAEQKLKALNKELDKEVRHQTIQLKKSEKQYKNLSTELSTILDHYPGLVFYKDTNNNFIRINQKVVDYYNSDTVGTKDNLTKRDIEGKNLSDLLPKDRAQTYWNEDLEVITSGTPKLNIEQSYNTEHGTKWFNTHKIPYFDDNGEIRGIIGFSLDITESKKAEQKLKDSENKFKLLFESIADPIHVIDADLKIMYMNPAFERWLKSFNLETNIVGKNPVELWPFIGENVNDEYQKVFKTKQINIREEWIQINNKNFYNETRKIPILKAGKVVQVITIIRDFSDRKKAELKLKESEKKFKLLYENAPLEYQSLDSNGNILEVNKAWINFFGYSKEEVIGKWFGDFIDSEYLAVLDTLFLKFKEKGEARGVEFDVIKKDSSHAIILLDGNINYDENGNFKQTHCIFHDITEQRQIQIELRENERLLKNAQELAQIGHWKLDPSTMELTGSDQLFKIFGLTHDKVPLEKYLKMIHPEDREMVLYYIRKGIEKGDTWDIEHRVFSKDGKEKLVHALGETAKNDDDKVILLMGTLQDITARKKIMEELRIKDIIFNASLSGQSTSDINGIIDHVNPSFLKMWGFKSKEEIIGKSVASFFANPNDVVPIFEVLNDTGKWEGEFLAKRYDGSTFISQGFASAIYNEKGEKIGFQSTNLNITKRKKAEQKVKSEKEKAQQYLDIAGVIIVALNQDQTVQLINQKGCEILEEEQSKIIGMNWFDNYIPQNVREQVRIDFNRILSGEIELLENYENEVITKSGQKRIISWYNHTLKNKTGQIIGTLSSGKDITAQKQAELKLKKSEEKFRKQNIFLNNILESLTHPFYVINVKDYKVILANSTASSTGLREGEYCYKLTHNRDTPCTTPCICPIDEVKKTKKSCIVEHIHYDREENEKIYEIYGYPILDENGNVVQMIEYALNITDRKLVQHELKKSEEKFRKQNIFLNNILESLTHPFYVINVKDYKVILANSTASSTGLREGEYCYKLTHNRDTPCTTPCICPIDEVKKTKKSCIVEHIHYDREENEKIYEIYGYPILDENGNVVQMIEYALNITDRKLVQHELKKSEEKYRHLFENSPYYIILFDKDGNFIDCNNSAVDIFGYPKEEFIGKNFREMPMNPPELLPLLENKMELLFKGEMLPPLQFIPNRKDGKKCWINSQASLIKLDNEFFMYNIGQDITERKKAERELKESEEKFRNFTEQSLMGIGIIQDNVIKYASKRLAEMYGYTVEELLNLEPYGFLRLIDPEFIKIVKEQATKKQLGQKEVIINYEVRCIKKTGEKFWVENYSKTINFNGKPADFITNIDITGRRVVEQEKKKINDFLNSFIENAQALVFVKNSNGIYQLVNKYYEDLFGLDRKEILGKTDNFIHPNHPKVAQKLLDNDKIVLDTNKVEIFEEIVIAKSEKHKFHTVKFPLYADKGDVSSVGAIAIDITELKETEEKLRESEEKYRLLFDNSPVGIGLTTIEGKVLDSNDAMVKLTGFSVEDLNKVGVSSIFSDPSQRSKIVKLMRSFGKLHDYEVKLRRKDNVEFFGAISFDLIELQGEKIIQISLRDITKSKKAELELIKLNNLKSELLRRTSHELKTPLVSIKGFSDLLLEMHNDKLDDYTVKKVNQIRIGCKRLESLVNDILKTAELESGMVELKKTKEDLSLLIKICVNELEGFLKLRNHTLNLKLSDNLICSVEKDQIHNVINNILSNAIKFTPSNGKIEINSEINNGFIIISIKDNGIGFSEEERSLIFKQFGKIERYGQGYDVISEGSGLGLYISKKIIEMHGGEIWVESEGRDKGSSFYFSLPIV